MLGFTRMTVVARRPATRANRIDTVFKLFRPTAKAFWRAAVVSAHDCLPPAAGKLVIMQQLLVL
jgi:hypothetical protein